MGKLESMQRLAEREAERLSVPIALTVRWASDCKFRMQRLTNAHAHTHGRDTERGTICIKRGLTDWRRIIKHEVAHFVKGSGHNSLGFLRARAKQGDKYARRTLAHRGAMRCPGHVWFKSDKLSQRTTARGLVVTYRATCTECGKHIP